MQNTIQTFLTENYTDKELLARMYFTDNGPVNTYCFTAKNLAGKDLSGKNCYMTLNTLCFKDRKIRRNQEHVSRLKFCYADLDTYNLFPSSIPADAKYYEWINDGILYELEKEHFGKTIPTPSYVISSGRGMYLLWRVDEHINALPRWKRVQKYLYDVLKEYGADSSVTTDYARVFRTIGSTNPKSGTQVQIIKNYAYKYTLYEIIQEYLPERKTPTPKNEASKGKFFSYEKVQKLYMDRMHDLKALLTKYRDQEDAHRECILFLYRYYYLCLYQDKENALKATCRLNASLQHPLTEEEVINATKSAEKYYDEGCSFCIKNEKLIEFLNIRAHEMDAMQSFLTEEKQKEKKRRINRRSYLNRLELEGKLTKEKKIIKRRQKVCELMQKGKSKEEICKNLEISRATYYADKKAIETVKNAIGRVHKQPEGEDKEYAFKERLSEACGALKDTYADVTDTRYFNTGPPA